VKNKKSARTKRAAIRVCLERQQLLDGRQVALAARNIERGGPVKVSLLQQAVVLGHEQLDQGDVATFGGRVQGGVAIVVSPFRASAFGQEELDALYVAVSGGDRQGRDFIFRIN